MIIIIIITVVRLPQFNFCCFPCIYYVFLLLLPCSSFFLRAFCWQFGQPVSFSSVSFKNFFTDVYLVNVFVFHYYYFITHFFHNFFFPLVVSKEANLSAIMRRLIMKYIFNKRIKVVFSWQKERNE